MFQYIYTLYVPTHDNDGSDRSDVYRTMAERLSEAYGGVTLTHREGAWVMADGRLCTEPIVTVAVIVPPDRLEEAEEYLPRLAGVIKKNMEQEAVLLTRDVIRADFI